MAMRLASDIIVDAIAHGLGLPRTNIQNDVIAQAVLYYNLCGKDFWDSFVWKNRYISQFNMTPSSGVITFSNPQIDIVVGIKALSTNTTTNEGAMVWAQQQVNAFRLGQEVSSDAFTYLPDDTSAGSGSTLRRIRVDVGTDSDTTTYRILALSKFTEVTTSNYTTSYFPIDHADYALVMRIADKLRVWDGNAPTDEWRELFATALQKVQMQEQVDDHVYPTDPTFPEVGDFATGGDGW